MTWDDVFGEMNRGASSPRRDDSSGAPGCHGDAPGAPLAGWLAQRTPSGLPVRAVPLPADGDEDSTRLMFDAIGTRWQIDTPSQLPLSVEARILAAISEFDALWSRFREDSIISAVGREGGTIPVGEDGEAMMRLYSRLASATGGAVNPLIGATLEHLGYDPSYRLSEAPGPAGDVPDWDGTFRGSTALLTLPRGTVLDVGALGKGRLVDVVCGILDRARITEYTVDAGGDMRHKGGEPLRVALEHPLDPTRAVGVIELGDGGLAASATNRRAWADGLHHVIDARTGRPVTEVVATWAVARNAMLADAASTAAFFLPPQGVLEALDGVDAVVTMPAAGGLRSAGLDGAEGPGVNRIRSAQLFG